MINTKRYVTSKSHRKPRKGRVRGGTIKYSLFHKFIEKQRNEQRLLDQLRKYVRENRNGLSEIREDNSIVTKEYFAKTPLDNNNLYGNFTIFNTNQIPHKPENILTVKPYNNKMDLQDNCTNLQPTIYLQKFKITNPPIKEMNLNPKLKELRLILDRIPTYF